MRCAPCLILLLSFAPALWGQAGTQAGKPGPRAAVRAKEPEPAIWVNFVPLASGAPVHAVTGQVGTLDLGRISYMGGTDAGGIKIFRKKNSFVVSTVIGLRVGPESPTATARLMGTVTEVSAASRISVDGVRLTISPQIIQMAVPLGPVTSHRLEIEVPIDEPEAVAQVARSIAFQVVAN